MYRPEDELIVYLILYTELHYVYLSSINILFVYCSGYGMESDLSKN